MTKLGSVSEKMMLALAEVLEEQSVAEAFLLEDSSVTRLLVRPYHVKTLRNLWDDKLGITKEGKEKADSLLGAWVQKIAQSQGRKIKYRPSPNVVVNSGKRRPPPITHENRAISGSKKTRSSGTTARSPGGLSLSGRDTDGSAFYEDFTKHTAEISRLRSIIRNLENRLHEKDPFCVKRIQVRYEEYLKQLGLPVVNPYTLKTINDGSDRWGITPDQNLARFFWGQRDFWKLIRDERSRLLAEMGLLPPEDKRSLEKLSAIWHHFQAGQPRLIGGARDLPLELFEDDDPYVGYENLIEGGLNKTKEVSSFSAMNLGRTGTNGKTKPYVIGDTLRRMVQDALAKLAPGEDLPENLKPFMPLLRGEPISATVIQEQQPCKNRKRKPRTLENPSMSQTTLSESHQKTPKPSRITFKVTAPR